MDTSFSSSFLSMEEWSGMRFLLMSTPLLLFLICIRVRSSNESKGFCPELLSVFAHEVRISKSMELDLSCESLLTCRCLFGFWNSITSLIPIYLFLCGSFSQWKIHEKFHKSFSNERFKEPFFLKWVSITVSWRWDVFHFWQSLSHFPSILKTID